MKTSLQYAKDKASHRKGITLLGLPVCRYNSIAEARE